ncbi:hypothetical protein [Streptomyces sp. H036]|uniref:hypothetical protein n=1 Tax=Streptomyces sp. H036 TaxID=1519487 RepID=UPI0006AE9A6A|nr:hypothetical protein [Streptomyces sp. H036]
MDAVLSEAPAVDGALGCEVGRVEAAEDGGGQEFGAGEVVGVGVAGVLAGPVAVGQGREQCGGQGGPVLVCVADQEVEGGLGLLGGRGVRAAGPGRSRRVRVRSPGGRRRSGG